MVGRGAWMGLIYPDLLPAPLLQGGEGTSLRRGDLGGTPREGMNGGGLNELVN